MNIFTCYIQNVKFQINGQLFTHFKTWATYTIQKWLKNCPFSNLDKLQLTVIKN